MLQKRGSKKLERSQITVLCNIPLLHEECHDVLCFVLEKIISRSEEGGYRGGHMCLCVDTT